MSDIRDDGRDYGRILGRIESNTERLASELRELKSEGKGRDKSLHDIEERVRANAHKAGNDLQMLSNRVEGLDGKVVNVGVSVDTANKRMEQQSVQLSSIDERVKKIEAPVNEALELREKRRAKIKRWWMWMAAVGVFLWGGFEPIYKTLMPVAIQRWFSINLPPH
jgi:chromosome segregation ATPase